LECSGIRYSQWNSSHSQDTKANPILRALKPTNNSEGYLRTIIRWGIYPFSWAIVATNFELAHHDTISWSTAWITTNLVLVTLYIAVELLLPYQRRWGATWTSFFTDLKYIVVNGSFLGLVKMGLALFAINMSGQSSGIASEWPLLLQVTVALLVFEALQYTIHRYMHVGEGLVGSFFWRVHCAHHLPQKLYVTMHVVGHPLNGLLIQTLVMVLPIWAMGYSEAACTAFLMINAIHGLISHFNVDARMGWMNYLFVGTELHRYHHSSALREAKNFGAVLSVYDQLFGTFVYKPSSPPKELGAANEERYPDYQNLLATLKFPFAGTTLGRTDKPTATPYP